MDAGYSFHCTPCGKAHAGECQPKTSPFEGIDRSTWVFDEASKIDWSAIKLPSYTGLWSWLPANNNSQTWTKGIVTGIDKGRNTVMIQLPADYVKSLQLGQELEVDTETD